MLVLRTKIPRGEAFNMRGWAYALTLWQNAGVPPACLATISLQQLRQPRHHGRGL